MSNCKVEKNAQNGKINKILDASGNSSTLFQELLNVPVLSLEETINTYKNIYSDKFKAAPKAEPKQEIIKQSPPKEVKVSDAKVEIKSPTFLTASQMKKADTSEKMMEIKERQDALKKKFEELEKLNNCLWN